MLSIIRQTVTIIWGFKIQKSWLQNSINEINKHDFANFNYLAMINFREML